MFSIVDTAHRLGRYAWFESRLFELAGAWSATEEDAAVAAFLAERSRRYAWHATLWAERIPDLRDPSPADLIGSGSGELAELVVELAGLPEYRIDILVRVVLAHLDACLADHERWCSPVSDGPVLRALELVRADLARDRVDAAGLLSPLATPLCVELADRVSSIGGAAGSLAFSPPIWS